MLKCDHMKLTSTRGGRLGKSGHGEGDKMPEFCGRFLWMAPKMDFVVLRARVSIFTGVSCVHLSSGIQA